MDRRITLVINLNTLFFFFFNDTATTEIYTLSLHDALPISFLVHARQESGVPAQAVGPGPVPLVPGRLRHLHGDPPRRGDRKSTRLNSSHSQISYAVFCLKKKKDYNLQFIALSFYV